MKNALTESEMTKLKCASVWIQTGSAFYPDGKWSGSKEIEAIAVDDSLGYVYY